MKKNIKRFTLVEMLTVVAIIGILAGLIIPTVIIAQNRGRETQAKTDISSIMTAIKQVKTDYNGKILAGSDYTINKDVKAGESSDVCTINGDKTDTFIAELSVPKNSALDQTAKTRINKRRKTYLTPKSQFDPTKAYTDDANKEALYRDPWGSQLTIYIKVKNTDELAIPDTSKNIASDVAIYSFGPNTADDKGCNSALDACIYSSDSSNHKNHDDIASWNL